MKHINIIMTVLALLTISCNAQKPSQNIPEMEYGDCTKTVNEILFFPNNIIDMIYNAETNEYVIEYDDADVFDYEMIYDDTVSYITIECTKEDFLYYVQKCSDIQDTYKPDSKFYIEEVVDDKSFRFFLRRY